MTSDQVFDYIIAGGGAAGLSLALSLSALNPKSKILIIDREEKSKNDRTWCFWCNTTPPFEKVIFKTWKILNFESYKVQKSFGLGDYGYHLIRGIDYYQFCLSNLRLNPNIIFSYSTVENILDGEALAVVEANGKRYSAQWIFTSIINPNKIVIKPERYHYLKQHFLGWEIQTKKPVFDPEAITLFDFRTPQNGAMRFMYVLPFSSQHALVEYTLFSTNLLTEEEYSSALDKYITSILGISQYTKLLEEKGIIPMTDRPFPRQIGKRIMTIGTLGGMVKPSSGYAFLRIQQDTSAIIHSLQTNGHPFNIPRIPYRYKFFDSTMLNVMFRHGDEMEHIFTKMFLNNPIDRIFRFLDETGSMIDNIKLLLSVPPKRFIQALIRIYLLGHN